MNPASGDNAPLASIPRSETSREVSVTRSRFSTPSGRSPKRSTRCPPWGAIKRCLAATVFTGPPPPRPRRTRGWTRLLRPREQAVRRAASCRHLRRDQAELLERLDHDLCRLLGRPALRLDDDLGVLRLLVRVVDAREARDLARERLLVEAVHVAASALLERGRDEDLHERAELLDHRPRPVPRLRVRRDRRCDHGRPVAGQPRGDPADPLDVRVPVLLREPEAL